MLFKLSIKNIQKSIKDYAVYFFTLIIGVAVFYMFNAIETQTILLDVSDYMREYIGMISDLLSAVSVFVSFILGFLIIYASRFLMKRRNKEFGVYLTLGMGKRKISMILFMETLMIGVISLVVGLGLGICGSQLLSVLVSNIFEADMTKFEFVVSVEACIKSVIYFGIMYFMVMLFNTVVISRCRLIELLQAGKKSEEVKMKNPLLCVVVFLISASALGYAYYIVTARIDKLDDTNFVFFIMALGAVSTFFIFWSVSGLLLKIVMHCKNVYYKGLNSFILRQISSKINTMVFSMTIICLMLFVTITVLSCFLSIKNAMSSNLDELAPVDLQMGIEMNVKKGKGDYNKRQRNNAGNTVLELYKKLGADIEPYFKEYVEVYLYETKELTFSDTLGSTVASMKELYPYMDYNVPEVLITISDYNKVAKIYGKETYSLAEDEYMIIANFEPKIEMRNEALKKREKITVFNYTLTPKYTECKDGFLKMEGVPSNEGIIVIPDAAADDKYIARNELLGNYKTTDKKEKYKIDEVLNSIEPYEEDYILPKGASRVAVIDGNIGSGAMLTFIGIYLGIIFLISSAAILALKELAESAENIERYQMLRRIGADEQMISKALFWQIGIFFLFPLAFACIHAVFGVKFTTYFLAAFGQTNLLPSIIVTAGILIFVYGGYFLITYMYSKAIIREK